jgi:hypothetical protein
VLIIRGTCIRVFAITQSLKKQRFSFYTEDDHVGKEIFLIENDVWKQTDRDYTPYSNILSAVWPTLR